MKCWFCGGEVRWCADFNADEYGYEDGGIVAELECMKCKADITCYQREPSISKEQSEKEAHEFREKLWASETFRARLNEMPGETTREKLAALIAIIDPLEGGAVGGGVVEMLDGNNDDDA